MTCAAADAADTKGENDYVKKDGTASGKIVRQAPECLPPLVSGKRFTAYTLFESGDRFPNKVTIQAAGPEGPVAIEVPVEVEDRYNGVVIHKMAAKFLIRDLEEGEKQQEAIALSLK